MPKIKQTIFDAHLTNDGNVALINGVLYQRIDQEPKKASQEAPSKPRASRKARKNITADIAVRIKELKEQGKTSAEVAEEIGVPLEKVNKLYATWTPEI